MAKVNRDEVIQEIYRTLRDNGFSRFNLVARDKNSLILNTNEQRIKVSFRINIEERKEQDE